MYIHSIVTITIIFKQLLELHSSYNYKNYYYYFWLEMFKCLQLLNAWAFQNFSNRKKLNNIKTTKSLKDWTAKMFKPQKSNQEKLKTIQMYLYIDCSIQSALPAFYAFFCHAYPVHCFGRLLLPELRNLSTYNYYILMCALCARVILDHIGTLKHYQMPI